MRDHGFVNVETPYLTRSTPEGARDFLVPVRLRPGNWYALPQSPQLFKQLLMVGGLERYYQLARCFRDEDFRKDRQPEITQIDLEMSFVTREDVIGVGEAIVSTLWREIAGYEIPLPLPRMTYADAMARFGSDKPDLRFGLELTDLTGYFAGTEFRVFQAPYVGAVVMPGGASQTRRELDAWQDWAKSRGARGLAYALIAAGRLHLRPGGQEHFGYRTTRAGSGSQRVARRRGVLRRGAARPAQELLGAARLEIGNRCGLIDASAWSFLWVVDAPMFEETDEGGWTAVHHPFTSPLPEWADKFATEPGGALADAYDIVCNGYEMAAARSASTSQAMQQQVFDVIGLTQEEAQVPVRLPARRVQVRPAAARRHGLRLGPPDHAARRRRHHPRRHRLPEGGHRRRPADRRPDPDNRRPSARKPASTPSPSSRRSQRGEAGAIDAKRPAANG